MKGAETDQCTRQFKIVRSTWDHELWAAVLEQAITDADCIFVPASTRVEQYRKLEWAEKAIAWFKGRIDKIGSFVWVCDVLGLYPDSIRREMLRRCASKIMEIRKQVNADEQARLEAKRQKRLAKMAKLNAIRPIRPARRGRPKKHGEPKPHRLSIVDRYFDSGGVARSIGDGHWVLGGAQQPGETVQELSQPQTVTP